MRRSALLTIALCLLAISVGGREMRVPEHLILGGELGNSSASSAEDIRTIFPVLKEYGLNTVLMPVYWELLEPAEGEPDFTLLDTALKTARENNLRLVLLWFGAWKNSMSCYAPGWVKTDQKRFPRAVTKQGKPLEIVSLFDNNLLEADSRAFGAMIDYLTVNDREQTVAMIQIENEIGMVESPRDFSKGANEQYAKGVPGDLAKILNVREGTPWSELADEEDYAEEMFMAWYYSRYVEHLARMALEKLPDTPLYVNAALDSRGRRPGQYPSAGPIARLANIWKAGAPSVDFISPDLYDPPFAAWMKQYDFPGNRLFIPEIRLSYDSGVHAFYAIGEHKALGFSPFSIENIRHEDALRLKEAYSLLGKLEPVIKDNESSGLLFDSENSRNPKITESDGLRMTASHFFTLPWDSRATDGSRWPDGGGMVIKLAPDDYIIAGSGIVVKWEIIEENRGAQVGSGGESASAPVTEPTLSEDGYMTVGADTLQTESSVSESLQPVKCVGILSCDEIDVDTDGTLRIIRRLNGDETHQGRHVRIGVDNFKALHVKLYRYSAE